MSTFKVSISVIILLSSLQNTFSQNLSKQVKFRHLSANEGLSSNEIRCIYQGQKGFMWFGTNNGLNRYDGYTCKVYQYDIDDESSISENVINAIAEDKEGRLWIATDNGLNLYDRNTECFTRFFHDPNNENSISADHIFSLLVDHEDNVWVGTLGGGLTKIVKNTSEKNYEFVRYLPQQGKNNSLGGIYVWAIYEDSNYNIWVGTYGGGLNLLDKTSGTFVRFQHEPGNSNSLLNNEVCTIAEDHEGFLWIGTNRGISRFNPQYQSFQNYSHDPQDPHSIDQGQVRKILVDQQGNIWLAALQGLSVYSPLKDNFVHIEHDENDPYSLSHNEVWSAYADNHGVLWFGTYIKGINIYHPSYTSFLHYKLKSSDPNGLSGKIIRAFQEDDQGNIWIGIDQGGLNYFDIKTQQFQHYKHNPDDPNTLSNNSVLDIATDSEGYIWTGNWAGDVNRFDVYTHQVKRFSVDTTNNIPENGWKLYVDNEQTLWVGTYGAGLFSFDRETEKFINYAPDPNYTPVFSDDIVFAIFQDRAGDLWVGTDRNFNVLNRESKHLSNRNPKGLEDFPVNDIFEDSQGRLWLATHKNGLNLYDRDKQSFKAYTTKDGLLTNTIYTILEDDYGDLWLGTDKGLIKFDVPNEKFTHFSTNHGLQDPQFNKNARFKSSNGEIYFGGNNGFNVFHPELILTNQQIPPVYITSFKIFNKEVKINDKNKLLKKSITETQSITLTHKYSVFSFEFVALDYIAPEKNQYAYQLEGFDQGWQYIGNKRDISYTNLDPGTYTLKIKASNNDGFWNEEGYTLQIIILPPWWETWWFRSLVVIVIFAVFITFYQVRIAIIRRQKRNLERLVHERTLELKEKNDAITLQTEELLQTNEKLSESQQEVIARNEELYQQSEELQQQRDYLKEANETISKRLEDIKTLSRVGQEITASVQVIQIIKTVHHNLNYLMDAPNFEIGIYKESKQVVDYYGYTENKIGIKHNSTQLNQQGSLTNWCISHQKEIFIQNVEEEIYRYINRDYAQKYLDAPAKTIIYIPLIIENQLIGIIVVKSFKKRAYSDVQLEIIRNLASYISIALDNAKAYEIVEKSSQEIQIQKRELELKNRQIKSSIEAAKTIQQAILPYAEKMERLFREHAVLYRPKDVVSGDFYWVNKVENKTILVVADCTGHGVPGAFMTLIGRTLLDKIIRFNNIIDPAIVLTQLHEEINKLLRQKYTNNNSGMDLCVLCIHPSKDDKTKVIFSGAKSDIYCIPARQNQIIELKGDRKSVGGRQDESKAFQNKEIILEKDSLVYVGSDGLVDQNDVKRKKFGKKRLRKLIEEHTGQCLSQQFHTIEQALDQHQIDTDQRDDILLLGFKI